MLLACVCVLSGFVPVGMVVASCFLHAAPYTGARFVLASISGWENAFAAAVRVCFIGIVLRFANNSAIGSAFDDAGRLRG